MHSSSHSPFATKFLTSDTAGLNLTGLHNPYATPITQELGARICPSPTSFPEAFSHTLQAVIANHENVLPENVFVGNSRAAIIHQLFTSLPPQLVLLVGPVPQEYPDFLEQRQIPFLQIPLTLEDNLVASPQALQKLQETRADFAILSTPNSVTGTAITGLQAIFSLLRAPRVLIDTSLQEFVCSAPLFQTQAYQSYLRATRPGTTLFLLNDLAAFFSCPGICLAYLVGDKHPLAALQRQAPPHTTTTYSQAMGRTLFQNLDEYRNTLPRLTADVAITAMNLRRSPLYIPDLVFEGPSFVCAGVRMPHSLALIDRALQQYRIHISCFPATKGLTQDFIRVSAITGDSLAYLDACLDLVAEEILR